MTDDTGNKDTTSNDDVRWQYLASVVVGVLLLSLPFILGLTALGIISLGAISQAWFGLYATITLMAAVWLMGEDTLNAVRKDT